MAIEPGHIVGSYVVEASIASGGMATVYRVRHSTLGSVHALKVLHAHLLKSAAIRQRFVSEGQIQSGLLHPNIVRVTDIIDEDGLVALVMDWVEGHTLYDHLYQSGPLEVKQAVRWTLNVLDALARVHKEGVVHRDIKPSNLMIVPLSTRSATWTGEPNLEAAASIVKLTDFGIAKVAESKLTRANSTMGTPCYMSPEQVADSKSLDHRSDLFAVGAVLYEMVTGTVAFEGGTEFESQLNIREGKYRPPQELRSGLPERLVATIRKALALAPASRFPDAAAFSAAIRPLLEEEQRATRPDIALALASPPPDAGPANAPEPESIVEPEPAIDPEPVSGVQAAAEAPVEERKRGGVMLFGGGAMVLMIAVVLVLILGFLAFRPKGPMGDRDGDGIPNHADACPQRAEDVDGFGDDDGCPEEDNDGDGVLDNLDRCPSEAEDLDGFRDKDGCPDPDNDDDGLPDAEDTCPGLPESLDGIHDVDGCPDPRVVTAERHTCALHYNGVVTCWGERAGVFTGPFREAAAAGTHTCGVEVDGDVHCWGLNRYGQANDSLGDYVAVATGKEHSCGLLEDGRPFCWGSDSRGQLQAPPGPFKLLTAGWYHTCGLRKNGAVQCWGDDRYGQSADQPGPFTSVDAGGQHTCGVDERGAVQCWGSDRNGRSKGRAGPFQQVSAGGSHTCGLRNTGSVECWGADNGAGLASNQAGPFVRIDAGDEHNCGIRRDGKVRCWGDDAKGRATPPIDLTLRPPPPKTNRDN